MNNRLDPTGGKKPTIIGYSINLLTLPIIGPFLCKLLGGGLENSKEKKIVKKSKED